MDAAGGMLYLFMKTLLALGASILLFVGLTGCSGEQKELRRQLSPNQKLVAVLIESITGGAGGGVHEAIYVNDQGIPLNLDKPVFSAVGCDRVSFEWTNDYLRHQSVHESVVSAFGCGGGPAESD